jgi:hypothetical protein
MQAVGVLIAMLNAAGQAYAAADQNSGSYCQRNHGTGTERAGI